MTIELSLRNLVAYAGQIALIAGTAAIAARLLGLRSPRVMLAYWQIVLFGCLVLPLFQSWEYAAPPPAPPVSLALADQKVLPSDAIVISSAAPAPWRTASLVFLAIGAGMFARSLWLVTGAFRLRRLRVSAQPLVPLPESFAVAQERVGARAAVLASDRLAGPITFGLLRPVVIVPPNLDAMPGHVQAAIAHHELLHVRRRDWVWEIFEEALRTIFWFHPVIWWLIGRIQLCREQVVDGITIGLIASRERYLDALLVVALNKSPV